MDWLIVTSAVSLGGIIGGMVYVTFKKQEKIDVKLLASIISVMVGAGVLGLFQKIAGGSEKLPRELYAYPIGLLLGIATVAFIEYAKHIGVEERARRLEREQRKKDASEKVFSDAKAVLVEHIKGSGSNSMSFRQLRHELGREDWTDEFVRSIIIRYPSELRNVSEVWWGTHGKSPGVEVLQSPHTN